MDFGLWTKVDLVAGRIGGAGDDHALGRRLDGRQRLGGELEARFRPAGDLQRRQLQGAGGVAIGDVARPGHGDHVTRLEEQPDTGIEVCKKRLHELLEKEPLLKEAYAAVKKNTSNASTGVVADRSAY